MRQSESRVRSNQSHAPNQIKPTYAKQEDRRAGKQTHRQNTRLCETARGHNETKEKRGGKTKENHNSRSSRPLYLAITSTYRPFFLPRPPAAPFLAVGAPSKSSIELALLSDVDGRDGGASPSPGAEPAELPGGVCVGAAAPVDTDRGRGGGAPSDEDSAGLPAIDGGAAPAPGPADDDGRLDIIGGVLAALAVLVVLLGGPIRLGGGGGVADGVALLGSFLLTHFFSSVS